MKIFLIIATLLVSLAVADDKPCPPGKKPGNRFCQTNGEASDLMLCNDKLLAVPIDHCSGRCIDYKSGTVAVCAYRGWDDPCEGGWAGWKCEKEGGPSGMRECLDGRNLVTVLCEGKCEAGPVWDVCYPEGWDDKCPEGFIEGQKRCDVPLGPGKLRECTYGRFVVKETCADVCDPTFGNPKCISRIN